MNDTDANNFFEVQHDLLFTDARKFGSIISIKSIQSDALKPAYLAFQKNIERVRIMSLVPQTVVSACTHHLLLLCQATFNVLGKPIMDDSEVDSNQKAISDEYDRLSAVNFPDEGGFFGGKEKMKWIFESDALHFNKKENTYGLARPGFVALLGAQVIGAWTAFTTLTRDLWIATVNNYPDVLSGMSRRRISLKTLLEHRYDTSGKMGQILAGRMRLDSFRRTKQAYQLIFKDHKDVFTGLMMDAIDEVCLIRTTLVHDAGRATEGFVSQAKKFPDWKDVRAGSELPLDGAKVARMSEAVVQSANRLTRGVDAWFVRRSGNSPKPAPPSS